MAGLTAQQLRDLCAHTYDRRGWTTITKQAPVKPSYTLRFDGPARHVTTAIDLHTGADQLLRSLGPVPHVPSEHLTADGAPNTPRHWERAAAALTLMLGAANMSVVRYRSVTHLRPWRLSVQSHLSLHDTLDQLLDQLDDFTH